MNIVLNEEQQQAVDCTDNKILCLAGAGTGKTFTMLQRISNMVKNGVSPSSILVLTFTNAAALEMKTRYKESHKMQKCPEFKTFHAFCYSLLSSDKSIRDELKYTRIPYIALDAVIKKTSAEALAQCGVSLSDKKINGLEKLTIKEEHDLEVYKKTLNRLLKKKNLITFDTLCYDVCALFVDDKECIQKYKERYKHIFVDEFQDTDPKQYKFICSFKDADMFVVGDALQSLYSFRGADSSIIKDLAVDPNWTTIKLHKNYRSTDKICEFANNMSTYANDNFRITIQSTKLGQNVVEEDMKSTKYYINDKSCLDTCGSAVNWNGTTAILCRTNSEVKSIQKYFRDNNLPFSMGNAADIGLNIIRCVKDESFMVEWLASFLYSDEYSIYIRESFEHTQKTGNYSLDQFMSRFGYKNDMIKTYCGMTSEIKSILKSDDPILYKWLDIFAALKLKAPMLPEDVDNEELLIEQLEYYLSGGLNEDSNVYIGTIHSSKGLEYDNVILVGVNGNSFPLTSEDNLNVYYVGITRAKNKLHIFRCDR